MNDAPFNALRNEVGTCRRCPLAETRLHAVFGEGPERNAGRPCGGGPRAKEDESGRPFVGLLGTFAGRTAGGGQASQGEAVHHEHREVPPSRKTAFLQKRRRPPAARSLLRSCGIRPRLVITAGNAPTRALLGTGDNDAARTFTCVWEGMELSVLPLFHPSYLLRNRGRAEGSRSHAGRHP